MRKLSRVESAIAFLLPAGLGASAAVYAIVDQSGYARGYTSLGLLVVNGLVALSLAIAGIVILSQGKQLQNALSIGLMMFAASFTLPASFLLVLFLVRKYQGE